MISPVLKDNFALTNQSTITELESVLKSGDSARNKRLEKPGERKNVMIVVRSSFFL